MPVLLPRRARRPKPHRQDACATAKRGETPKGTQARCLCYCQEGRDAQRHTGKMPVLLPRWARRPKAHRQDACATTKMGETPKGTQARCLCYCQDGRDAQRHTGKMPVLLLRWARRPKAHRQDACATAKTGETPKATQARCLCYCQEGRDAQRHTGKMPVLLPRGARRPKAHRQDACATAKMGETPKGTQARCLCYC
jgi:cell division septation protein DedD